MHRRVKEIYPVSSASCSKLEIPNCANTISRAEIPTWMFTMVTSPPTRASGSGPWTRTPGKIRIEDIAHALSNQCRFGGHCSRYYSVAEHSVHVSRTCAPEDALWGLLHDAAEAYLVDVPRSLNELPEFKAYQDAESRLMRVIAARFGLAPDQPASVTEADETMLWVESHSLLGSIPEEAIQKIRPPFEILDTLRPPQAEDSFLERFKALTR